MDATKIPTTRKNRRRNQPNVRRRGLITEAYLTDIIHKKMNDELLLPERNGTEEDTFFDAILYETTKASIPNPMAKPEPGMIQESCSICSILQINIK